MNRQSSRDFGCTVTLGGAIPMKKSFMKKSLLKTLNLLILVIGIAGLESGIAQAAPDDKITYSKDIANIIFEKCASCHNPDGIGPMSLLDLMPPIPELPNGSIWQLSTLLGEPDFVVQSPPYTVAANAQDQWWVRDTPFEGLIDQPRYVRATELKGSYPQGVKVLHHGHATLRSVDQHGNRAFGPVGRQGVGKSGDVFNDGTGMLIYPTGSIRWNLHYFPINQEVANEQTEAAVWLYPKGYKPEFLTRGEQFFAADTGPGGLWAGDIVLPPNSIKSHQGVRVLDRPALITSFRPHMHMRGKAQSLVAVYPDGRREMLARVDKYNHSWQIAYQFEDDVAPLLPKGTMLMLTSTWDNTADNPNNPDHRQWVVFGQRGVDEMSHTWLGITYLVTGVGPVNQPQPIQ